MNNTKKIIKIAGLLIILILITLICVLSINYNNAQIEESNTPVIIVPKIEKKAPEVPKLRQKPVTRDENNMPKSDYKVPEIG